ncbi:glycosyltransferase involved in cell wall biosynthesis [Roseimicrobium gellanilyticum]|uniref:Glycosyltransferase involved in cell wall biosynthesis n=2 Tax=Roseimicrobium gellanilyticum TaxID=748857 RepID=A0A366H4X9_9BACT|nr:glycosyltransferase involved in cell wall biosynthesis [Roseimicrobium gellanilyticum]
MVAASVMFRRLLAPKISLLHATRGRPEQALEAREKWIRAASNPRRIEHVFAADCDDESTQRAIKGLLHRVVPEKGGGCVAAWNLAAQASTGDVLVQLSDDWTPIPGWDEEFVRRLRDVRQPGVLRPSDGHRRDDLLCMAILTRARLKQQGEFLHSGYLGIYSDDEFSFRAYQDGVVIDARDLVLIHDHPNYNSAVEMDETYLAQNSTERDKTGRKIFLKRNPRAKGHWLHEGRWERFFVPLPAGESWNTKPPKPAPTVTSES